jgi:hypothetical protein
MAESSVVASRVSDWAAVDAACRRSLARGVCAIMKLMCFTAIVLFCAKNFNAAFHIRGCILRCANPEPGFGNMCCSTKIAELAETDAVNFAGASPSAVIESSVRIFRRRVQEENTLPPVTRS